MVELLKNGSVPDGWELATLQEQQVGQAGQFLLGLGQQRSISGCDWRKALVLAGTGGRVSTRS